ncbi:MAG: hypothetical protein ACKVYV_02940 [Limisphaerales bacterium]
MPKVAVSSAWKEESAGPNAAEVQRFSTQLRAAGVEVLRDKDVLRTGTSVSEFERTVSESDFLRVFPCDAHLKSPHRMHELLVAWQRSRDCPDADGGPWTRSPHETKQSVSRGEPCDDVDPMPDYKNILTD